MNPDGSWKYDDRPCVRLRDVLYGHPGAGFCWERHCNQRLSEFGFKIIDDWPSCFDRPVLKFFLTINVDDFKLAGPEDNLKKGWSLLAGVGLKLEPLTPPGFFLGCIQERIARTMHGVNACGFPHNMASYLTDTVARYCDIVEKETGEKLNFSIETKLSTPSPPEDTKDAHAGRPLCSGPCALCLHCMTSSPVWKDCGTLPHGIGLVADGLIEGTPMSLGVPFSPIGIFCPRSFRTISRAEVSIQNK